MTAAGLFCEGSKHLNAEEERGFDEGHGMPLAARAIIQEPLSSFLTFTPLPMPEGSPHPQSQGVRSLGQSSSLPLENRTARRAR
jgi:hypothetical protein